MRCRSSRGTPGTRQRLAAGVDLDDPARARRKLLRKVPRGGKLLDERHRILRRRRKPKFVEAEEGTPSDEPACEVATGAAVACGYGYGCCFPHRKGRLRRPRQLSLYCVHLRMRSPRWSRSSRRSLWPTRQLRQRPSAALRRKLVQRAALCGRTSACLTRHRCAICRGCSAERGVVVSVKQSFRTKNSRDTIYNYVRLFIFR